jgi:TonB family protein
MRKLVASILAALVIALPAAAQAPTASRQEPRPITRVAPEYADAERAAGVQGEVVVRGTVQLDGSVTDGVIVTSSRAPTLDQAALAAFQRWTFAPATEGGQPVVSTVEQRIAFHKDSLDTLAQKTCADLGVDIGYFQRTFPELQISDMPLRHVSVGLVMVMAPGGMTLDVIRRATAAFDRTVEWCATHPDGLYLDRYLRFARR